MKHWPAYLIIAALVGYILIPVFMDKPKPSNEAALKSEITRLKHREDSLQHALTLTRDSLSISFQVMQSKQLEALEAHKRTEQIRKYYEKIRLVPTVSDHERDSVLKALYPTLS